jgi:hypothetical protein
VNRFGKIVLVGGNVPRFDHNPTTRESKGLLIEETRTNVIYPSSDWSSTNWTHENSNTTQEKNTTDTEDPAGTFHATKITPTTASTARSIYWGTNITFTNTVNFTMSAFAKSTTGLHLQLRPRGQGSGKAWATFNLTTGVVGNSGGSVLVSTKIEKYPNNWYRCSLTFTGGGHTGGGFGALIMDDGNDGEAATHTGDTSKSIFFWGAQFETGSFATSYIPTDSAAATRGVDITIIDGDEFTEFYNDNEWTMITDTNVDNSQALVASPSAVNSINFEGDNNTKKFQTRYVTSSTDNQGYVDVIGAMSGTTYFDLVGATIGAYNVKTAFAAKVNDVAASFNGGTVQTDTSVTMLEGGSIMNIGQNPKQFHIKRVMYYPKRLPNSQLVTLTS